MIILKMVKYAILKFQFLIRKLLMICMQGLKYKKKMKVI